MNEVQQRSKEWHEQRKLRITGSRVGAILGISPWQKPDDVIREMVRDYHGYPSEFRGGPHIDHGVNNEQRALLCFMRESGLNVEQCGFFEYGDRMGASPDGLTSDGGVLELKVPYGLRNGGEFKPLSEQPHYAAQVQMEMLSTRCNHAYFAQYIAPKGDPLDVSYIPEQINIERVELDENWIDSHLPTINELYAQLLKELDNEDHLEPLRAVIDAPELKTILQEIDGLREQMKKDKAREKFLMQHLIDAAGGKNAEIHGRKLTLVKGGKSVAYAKAVKELLPDADLEPLTTQRKDSWRLY